MRAVHRTHGKRSSLSVKSPRTQTPIIKRKRSNSKLNNVTRTLKECRTLLLIASLIFNCFLLYMIYEPFISTSTNTFHPHHQYTTMTENRHNDPIKNRQHRLQEIKFEQASHMIIPSHEQHLHNENKEIIAIDDENLPNSEKNKKNPPQEIHKKLKGRLRTNRMMNVDNAAPETLSQNEYMNKQSHSSEIKVITENLPDPISKIADVNKRELTWSSVNARGESSPLSWTKSDDEHLYITKGEQEIWFYNRFFVFEDAKVAFCVMEKNSCSMFKQIFKRIRGKSDYLSTDYTKIHYLPYRGLQDISFYSIADLNRVMNDEQFYFAAFVREPLERLVSGYTDKCIKKRGVNLCDYARWSPYFKKKYGTWKDVKSGFTPPFDIWAHGLFHCPCWPETDWHFAPQFNFCNLYQYVDKYDIFRFENKTHRKTWMERAGFWDKYGKSGWGDDTTSIVDFGPKSHSSTNKDRDVSKYIATYKNVNPDILATIIDNFRMDYVIFGIQMPLWMCDTQIPINDNVKRAMRTLPRTSRPPCDDNDHRWLFERE